MKRRVIIEIETDETGGKCDEGCSLRYKTTWYDWCPFELDRTACRAAEIEVDEELTGFSRRVTSFGLDCIGGPKKDRLLRLFSKAYLKFAKAAGMIENE